MADPIDPNNADEKAAKIAELQAKMAEAKARRLAGEASGSAAQSAPSEGAAPSSSASASPSLAIPPGTDPDKAAKIAELQAKMAAAKAKREAEGGAGSPAGATADAAAGGAVGADVATATVTAVSEADAKIAAVRAKIAEERKGGGPPKPLTYKEPVKDDAETGVWFLGRRNFLQSVGWMSFFGFLTIVILGAIRAMFPRVIYERPPVFKAGFPGDYVPGSVSEKYKDEERVWIIRQNDGAFVALLAICTHLGCTPRWLASENKFKCPCHGSGFRGNPSWGVNFEGPAPRPLERVAIHLAPDGQIEIDKSKKFLWEKQQWDDPAATLKV